MPNAKRRPARKTGSDDFSEGEQTDDRSIASVVEVRDVARLDAGVRQLVGGAA